MVRPKDQTIWKHFKDSGDKSAMCAYCEHKYKFAHIAKMRNHLLKCARCPDMIKEDLERTNQEVTAIQTQDGVVISMRNIEEDVRKQLISLTKIGNSDNVVPDPDLENIKTAEDDDSRPDDGTMGIESMEPVQMSTPNDTDEETEETKHKESYIDPLEIHFEEDPDSEDNYKAAAFWKMALEKRRHMLAMRKMDFQIKKEMLKQAKIKTRMMVLEFQIKRRQLLLKNKLRQM